MNDPLEDPADYSRTPSDQSRVPDRCAGWRLDQVLAEVLPQHSRNRLQTWVREGRVAVSGRIETQPKHKLLGGEILILSEPPGIRELAGQPEDIPLAIVFEDEALLVIDKPPGLVVHPGSGNWSGTLMNALLHHVPAIAEVPRAGIVHRLDKDTSGLLVVAKTLAAQTGLVRQLQARSVKRQYLAVVCGVVRRDATIAAPVGRHPVHRTKMAVVPETRGGKAATTHFRVLEQFARCALVECRWKPGAPTRSACTWRRSGIRCSAIQSMASPIHVCRRFPGRPCMRPAWPCCIRSAGGCGSGRRRRQRT